MSATESACHPGSQNRFRSKLSAIWDERISVAFTRLVADAEEVCTPADGLGSEVDTEAFAIHALREYRRERGG